MERAPSKILCVAPGGTDKIIIMNDIQPNVINAIQGKDIYNFFNTRFKSGIICKG